MLNVKNIYKTYNMNGNSLTVIKNLSMNVSKGEFISIMGPSGSGKSTLMNILGFLDTPTKGHYIFEGKEVKNYRNNQLAEIRNRKIGFIFQKFNLLPRLNAYENVELPLMYRGMHLKERKKRVTESLKQVGLLDRKNHKPSELSGGQQQRVAIARAIAGYPDLVLADEPTGNLDSKSGEDIIDVLNKLNSSGITIIIVTHDKNVAKRCNRIIELKDGRIINK